jgi:hypothetical protein
MVMEYIPGVELFDDILARKKYSENDARPVFNQIASAVGYLHERHIVHRDIKPENIKVIAGSGGQATSVRLLDFGLSKDLNEGGMPSVGRTFVGTPCYLAPEVELVRNDGSGPGYGVEVDCWSLGAVLYVMLVARFPEFDRTSGSPMVKLDGELWQSVSAEARDLIRQLMTPDPSKRMTVTQALQHPWMLCQLDGASNASPRGEVVREGEGSLGTSMESVSADQMSSLVGSVERMSTEDRFPTDSIVPRAAVRRPGGRPVGLTSPSDALIPAEDARHRQATGFLIVLHLKVSKLFAAALQTYQSPSLSLKIRERAFLGRAQLEATVTVLRKLDALSMQIVDGLKEVMEAVKEDVPMLAHNILELQRQWVTKLRQEMLQVKQSNTALMQSLNHLIDDVESSSVLSHMPHQDVPSGGEEPSVQQVGDLPVLRMQGDYGALVERMRDTDHISGDQFLNLLMPTVETSPPVSPGRGKSAAEERSLSPLHRLSFLLQQVRCCCAAMLLLERPNYIRSLRSVGTRLISLSLTFCRLTSSLRARRYFGQISKLRLTWCFKRAIPWSNL